MIVTAGVGVALTSLTVVVLLRWAAAPNGDDASQSKEGLDKRTGQNPVPTERVICKFVRQDNDPFHSAVQPTRVTQTGFYRLLRVFRFTRFMRWHVHILDHQNESIRQSFNYSFIQSMNASVSQSINHHGRRLSYFMQYVFKTESKKKRRFFDRKKSSQLRRKINRRKSLVLDWNPAPSKISIYLESFLCRESKESCGADFIPLSLSLYSRE